MSRTTIRRRREVGGLPGAVLDEDRGWLIPVEDLLAAGFRLNAPAPPDMTDGKAVNNQAPAGMRQDTTPDETAASLQAELERLRHEHALALAQEQYARALAEAEARHLKGRLQERTAHIEYLQRALAALTPAPDRVAIPQPAQPFPTTAVPMTSVHAPIAAEGAGHGSTSGKWRRCRSGRV
ncbi:hypothetical protein B7767_28395 [Streptomyces sp. 13-12-16]|uniref:hypothetical protein n=1 Tax=Streptomyces sp. 13-12-16 TaxID=1570823 RepID=UPI000A1F38E7|nr:hypothetical protein [Streptomyces sp. 13-12-16]OSP40044.1 hypothetical protein B7767_28395 [Streptomyces sp. 13-12-16]